jgi:predicted peptidase
MMLHELVPAYDIDTARIYAAGHSMDGGGAICMIYIEYISGSAVPNGHLTHRASFENAGIRHWLFSQRSS